MIKETIEIHWFKTDEEKPQDNIDCYGAYYYCCDGESDFYIYDDVRFNRSKNRWESLVKLSLNLWCECRIPDYWAYKQYPNGPKNSKGD